MSPRSARPAFRRHAVTAVLVAHDGEPWLPDTLSGLAAQTRPAQRVVAVDTGSTDRSHQLLIDAVGGERVVGLPRDTAFGAAVAAGLSAVDRRDHRSAAANGQGDVVEWVWLLHDDGAPAPDALHELLAVADVMPSVGVVGPKCRTWDGAHLAEVGVTTDLSGRRETGVERHEVDQGQHDAVRDVLAVNTAGALIRRDVWDRLGGIDAALPLLRTDIDLGWRANRAGTRVVVAPAAVVRHAAAVSSGLRPLDTGGQRRHRAERQAALHTLLANLPAVALLLALPRLALVTLVRAVTFLLGRRPAYAVDEVLAFVAVVGRPARLRRARERRAATAEVGHRDIRHLFARVDARVRALRDALRRADAASAPEAGVPRPRGAVPVEPGPVAAEAENFVGGGSGLLRRTVSRPGVLLFVTLSVVALVAGRHLLSGPLVGGRLLPPPDGATDWWHAYVSGWHGVGSGSQAAAPPYLAVLAAAATVLFGKPWLVLDVLLIGAVPLSGLAAYRCAATLTRNRSLRVWAAASYGLLPVATGAVAAGRLDVVVVMAALPLLLRATVRTLRRDPRFAGWRTAVATGLGLAVVASFAPVVWLLVALLGLLGCLGAVLAASPASLPGARRRCLAMLLALAMPPVLLLPWTGTVVAHPSILVAGVGRAAAETVGDVPAQALLFGNPGGPGTPWLWLYLPVVVAALVALTRPARRSTVVAAWAVAGCGLALALATSRITVTLPDGAVTPVWPGVGAAVTAAGLLAAALVGADGASQTLARRDFGWRHAAAGGLAVLCAAVPLVAAGSWLHRGAGDPLRSGGVQALPAFVTADLDGPTRPRALLLRMSGGTVSYAVQRGSQGPTTGDADVARSTRGQEPLAVLVGRLAAGAHGDLAAQLAGYDIRYVAALGRADALSARLDRVSGLTRVGGNNAVLWQVVPRTGRVLVLQASAAHAVMAGGLPTTASLQAAHRVPSGTVRAQERLAPGEAGRLLVLAETAASGWHASLDGTRLTAATAYGWAQAFELPADGGALRVWWSDPTRGRWLALQAVLVALAGLFSLPSLRRDDDPARLSAPPSPPRPRAPEPSGVSS